MKYGGVSVMAGACVAVSGTFLLIFPDDKTITIMINYTDDKMLAAELIKKSTETMSDFICCSSPTALFCHPAFEDFGRKELVLSL